MTSPLIPALAAAGCILALAACDHPPSLGPGEVTFGNAVRQNMAAQIVNPDPVVPLGVESTSGIRAAGAVARYEADAVETPADIGTTDVIDLGE